MANAVWVYPQEIFRERAQVDNFLRWASTSDVKLVILHFKGEEFLTHRKADPNVQHFIECCHTEGLQVHGMLSSLKAVPPTLISEENRDCFVVDYHGISVLDEPLAGNRHFMCPSSAKVVNTIVAMARNIVRTYPELKGIQLDFIRFYEYLGSFTLNPLQMGHDLALLKTGPTLELASNGQKVTYFLKKLDVDYCDPPIAKEATYVRNHSFCFCPRCLKKFSEEVGYLSLSGQALRQYVREKCADDWYSFRSELITNVVRQVREGLNAVGSYFLSATIWYNSPYGNQLVGEDFVENSEYSGFGQAWWKWAEEELVDFLCPMNYWLDAGAFEEITRRQVLRLPRHIPLFSGVLNSHEYDGPARSSEPYLQAAQKAGASGLCFFRYGTWKQD